MEVVKGWGKGWGVSCIFMLKCRSGDMYVRRNIKVI